MTASRPKTTLALATECPSRLGGSSTILLAFAMAAGSLIGASACGQGAADSASTPSGGAESSEVASVALALELGGAVEIDTVDYDITGGGFHRAGSFDVSHSSSASAVIDSVPFGTGYVATLTASSSDPVKVDCSGTASFDVSGGGITAVPVHVTCKEAPTTPPPPPPPSVPVPRSSLLALTSLLLAAGIALLGRASPRARERRAGLL